MEKMKVLFLCTGNSCRSQMAEAIVNSRLGDQWQAFSAGTNPAGYVHPMAKLVLSEIGIEHEGLVYCNSDTPVPMSPSDDEKRIYLIIKDSLHFIKMIVMDLKYKACLFREQCVHGGGL